MTLTHVKLFLIIVLIALPTCAQDGSALKNCFPANANPLVTIISRLDEVRTSSLQIESFVEVLRKCEEGVGYVVYTSGAGKVRKKNLKYIAQLKDLLVTKHGIESKRLIFVDRDKAGQEAVRFYLLHKSAAFPDQ